MIIIENGIFITNEKKIMTPRVTLKNGEVFFLEGRNGTGKTTFLKHICRVLKKNDVSFSFVPAYDVEMDDFSIKEVIDFYSNFNSAPLLKAFGLEKIEQRTKVFQLSSGWKKKLCLSLALNKNHNFWILDEPFNFLDHDAKVMLIDLMIEHIRLMGTIVFSSHNKNDFEQRLVFNLIGLELNE